MLIAHVHFSVNNELIEILIYGILQYIIHIKNIFPIIHFFYSHRKSYDDTNLLFLK